MRSTLTLLMPHTGSLLADQQNKHSDSYQQGKQNTDDERKNRMPIGRRFRSSAFLCRSDTQPEEKFVHRPRMAATNKCLAQSNKSRRDFGATKKQSRRNWITTMMKKLTM